jgi:Sec1 family
LLSLLKLQQLNPAFLTLADAKTRAFTEEYCRVAIVSKYQYADANEDKAGGLNSLVVVIHKDFDVGTSLHHPWSYQGLIQEVYTLVNNKATHRTNGRLEILITDKAEANLDYGKDNFWQQQRGKEYQEVADAIIKEVENWKREYDAFVEPHNSGVD